MNISCGSWGGGMQGLVGAMVEGGWKDWTGDVANRSKPQENDWSRMKIDKDQ